MVEGLEFQVSQLSFWKYAALSLKLYHQGPTICQSGLVFYNALMLGLVGYSITSIIVRVY